MSFRDFMEKYIGMLIGIATAILIIILDQPFKIVKMIEYILIIIGFGYLGNYIQSNKEIVKTKLKTFIDKL